MFGLGPGTVRTADGTLLTSPSDWSLLPSGDAALTRRLKAAGDQWMVAEKRDRKLFSRDMRVPAKTNERIQADLQSPRSTESFAKRQEGDVKRRK